MSTQDFQKVTKPGDVACKPFPAGATAPRAGTSGLVGTVQSADLTELEVLWGNVDMASFSAPQLPIVAGSSVFVRTKHAVQPWAKEVFRIGDQAFILVPVSEVVLVQKPSHNA